MALRYVITQQHESVCRGTDVVVIGEPDPVRRPVWGGQSPGVVWQEWDLPVTSEGAEEG